MMYSMYETIMSLPLFKGASHEIINSFAEKTVLSFHRFQNGDVIITPGMECDTVKCVLDGRIRIAHTICNNKIEVSESVGPHIVLGVEHLFGIDTKYGFKATALGSCGIMEFSKKQYIQQLCENQLILINYLNYLSRRAQCCIHAIEDSELHSVGEKLRLMVETVTQRKATEVRLKSKDVSLQDIFGHSEEYTRLIDDLLAAGVVTSVSDYTLVIESRDRLIEYLS